ncbi:hypothetical protein CSB20_06405 [bacterium DOLZORAL124_64_63]|nr:MAG: hypothetical protein CSB20_06405 [bacterium DOLZORAL124_64_63]
MIRFHQRMLFLLLILVLGALPTVAQVLETFPAHGSVQTGPCGPFGVRMGSATLLDPETALTVRGSATGLRARGQWHVSAAGDTVLFTPLVPFAPGEEVTITVGEGHSRTWRTLIRPDAEHRLASLTELEERVIDLGAYLTPGSWEQVAWAWADLNGDQDQEGLLLVEADGGHQLLTVVYRQDTRAWVVRAPADCTPDNPLDLLALDLNGNARQDAVLLSLTGLQVWRDPGTATSLLGAQAVNLDFPVGFHARTVTAGDVDGDGDVDLVVLGLFGLEYLTILNDGQGGLSLQAARALSTVTPPADKNTPWPVRALLRDADGDGLPDLVWAADYQEGGAYLTRLARGLGDGRFAEAVILSRTSVFARALVFGRLLDPWDDSPRPPVLATALPLSGAPNFCGFSLDGGNLATPEGCITVPDLGTGSSPLSVGHALAGDGYPELWFLDNGTGRVSAVTLDAAPAVESLETGRPAVALATGDHDFDGDLDLALSVPQQSALVLLETPGGNPPLPPSGQDIDCGGVLDFGIREMGCPAADTPFELAFINPGLYPARVLDARLDDPDGVYGLDAVPAAWFGSGCLGPAATVVLPVRFAPADTLAHNAELRVTMQWVGAAGDGGDSTVVCNYTLRGQGGIHRLEDGGSGIGALLWSQAGGYATDGASLDFGILPALNQITMGTAVHLTNSGHFPLRVTPPQDLAAPFALNAAQAVTLAPGQTQEWGLTVQPDQQLLPGGVTGQQFSAVGNWRVRSLNPADCLGEQLLPQNLSVYLQASDPRLVPDPDCADGGTVAAEVDTLTVIEDGTLAYCLDLAGWDWPDAEPQVRILENSCAWVQVEVDGGRVRFLSDVVGAVGGDILLEARDQTYPTVFRTFRLTLLVEASRPDLAVVDMHFEPLMPGGEIQQQYPFYVNVVVESTRESAEGASMELQGGPCICPVEPLGKVMLNLRKGVRDTVRFMVESCAEAGECPFTACLEPAGGLAADFDPSNNCFTLGAAVAPNGAPSIEISNLVLTPDDPTLTPCDNDYSWNDLQNGMVEAFGVREGNTLSFDVRSVDLDGDRTRLTVGLLPLFVHATASGDTMVSFEITPPEGTVTEDVCQEFGPLVFQVIETETAQPETTTVEIPLFVKWEGPDLQATLMNVPVSAGLAEVVRFNGRVRCLGYSAGPFTAELWVLDPEGNLLATNQYHYDSLGSGQSVNLPQVMFAVEVPGEYCAHIALVEGRDVNPENNTQEICFQVASGPFTVSPDFVTPNGDGHNDAVVFRFRNQIMPNPMVRIFDLTGHLVFETSSLDSERNLVWDGRDQGGHLMPPGSYLYVVYDDGREFRTGTCGVIR